MIPTTVAAIIVFCYGARKPGRRAVARMACNGGLAPVRFDRRGAVNAPWVATDADPGMDADPDGRNRAPSIAIALPVSSAERATELSSILAEYASKDIIIATGAIKAGRGWESDARVTSGAGTGDKFKANDIRARARAYKARPYLRDCDASADDGGARKELGRIVGRDIPERLAPGSSREILRDRERERESLKDAAWVYERRNAKRMECPVAPEPHVRRFDKIRKDHEKK